MTVFATPRGPGNADPADSAPSNAAGSDSAPGGGGAPAGRSSRAALWRAFLLRRGFGAIINIFLIIVATFFIVQLIPGDSATAIAGDDASLAEVEQVRAELGLDRPVIEQFGTYLASAVRGDFGDSFKYGIPALDIVTAAAPYTLAIALAALTLVMVVGVGSGLLVGIATRGDRRRWLDVSFTAVTSVLQAIPPYLKATLLVLVFAIWLAVLPPAYSLAYAPATAAILPVIALSLGGIASVARIVRRETGVAQEMDYMRTAQGWRLPAMKRYLKHLLPNLLTTSLTLAGIILTSMLGSALIVETVFAWPGIGTTVIQAIAVDKDYPVIQAAVFVIGTISVLMTLLIDIVLGLIDPRTLGGTRE